MLFAVKDRSPKITSHERLDGCLYLRSEAGLNRLMPMNDSTIRISFAPKGEFKEKINPGIALKKPSENWEYTCEGDVITLTMPELIVKVNAITSAVSYYDKNGKTLLKERSKHPKITEEFTTYKLSEKTAEIDEISTADGKKKVVRSAEMTPNGQSYHSWVHFEWSEGEDLYGLGQYEEGFGSLRGQTVFVHQGNRKIAVPVIVSTLGYGLLMDSYSPMVFSDTPYGSYIYSEAVSEIDYYFMNGGDMAGVTKQYRKLTGKAVMLPKWAFGYIQSKERYETQEQILFAASECRKRGIGLDCIVLDWMSWEGAQWGQKTFDKSRFPDPDGMTKTLHDENVKFMISIWPSVNEITANRKEFNEKEGLMLPACDFYNAFSDEARALYWKQANEGLFCHGIDAWWCDNCEPFCPEWETNIKPEPSDLMRRYYAQSSRHMPAELTNAYALYHNRGIYEGQRSVTDEKRVVNLTRSGYLGQQRYGNILWSGDIAATWDTLHHQIAAGLGFSASGLPYWTMDIGAFFIKDGLPWYWKGDYDNTVNDPEYRELFLRWYQWGSMLPVFRGHGTDCDRELWHFGDKGDEIYDALVKANNARYELMPYIYSLAGRVWLDDESMMRYLAFDYPEDKIACQIKDQYMFGDSIMVCPVYEKTSVSGGIRKIYLPEGVWYDMATNERYEGGRWIEKSVPLDEIPLFVKAGGIVPKTKFALSTSELSNDLDIYVYAGASGNFKMYDDAGDGYAYENGEYETCLIEWDDDKQMLNVSNEKMLESKNVSVHIIK